MDRRGLQVLYLANAFARRLAADARVLMADKSKSYLLFRWLGVPWALLYRVLRTKVKSKHNTDRLFTHKHSSVLGAPIPYACCRFRRGVKGLAGEPGTNAHVWRTDLMQCISTVVWQIFHVLNMFYYCVSAILEVLRGMQELDVPADLDTFTTYILPSFGSVDGARTALKVIPQRVLFVRCICSKAPANLGW